MKYLENKEDIIEILILGKIGSGKSSLINYLLDLKESDLNYCEVGEGKRTTARGIFKKEGELNGIKYNLYDSMGLETSLEHEKKNWFDMINHLFDPENYPVSFSQQTESEFLNNVDRPLNGYFHCIFYCIKADAKLEDGDIDIEMIKILQKEHKQQVVVVLTNCDRAELIKIEALKKEIEKFNIYTIESSTKEGQMQTGSGILMSKKKGKEQIKGEIIINFFYTMIKQVPFEISYKLKKEINDNFDILQNRMEKEIKNHYDKIAIGIIEGILGGIKDRADMIYKGKMERTLKLEKEIQRILNDYIEYSFKNNALNIINGSILHWENKARNIVKLFDIEEKKINELTFIMKNKEINIDLKHDNHNKTLIAVAIGTILLISPWMIVYTKIVGSLTLIFSRIIGVKNKRDELIDTVKNGFNTIKLEIFREIDNNRNEISKELFKKVDIKNYEKKIRKSCFDMENQA